MIAAIIIVFREVLEAALIISIVLSATRGVPRVGRWVSLGLITGLVGATFVAQFAGAISNSLAGSGQELFNATVLLTAVIMLAWHNVWMSTHGRQMAIDLNSVGSEVVRGGRPLYALTIVVGLAVLREGSETVLFLYGLAAQEGGFSNAIIGGLVGMGIGVCLGFVLYFGLLRIPSRYLFSVTSWMITLLAAGMAAQSMNYLSAAGFFELGDEVWDSSNLLDQGSILGKILHTLIGYMDHPTSVQLMAYLVTLLLIACATQWVSTRQQKNYVSS